MATLQQVSPAILAVMDWRRLRETIAKERNRAGLTLDGLANASGVNRTTIHRIENVKKRVKHKIDVETLEKLATGLGLTLSTFFAAFERSQNAPLKSSTPPIDNPPEAVVPTEGADHVDVDEAVIERASDKLAAALIAYVRRLAEGDAPAATPRRPATRRRPRVR